MIQLKILSTTRKQPLSDLLPILVCLHSCIRNSLYQAASNTVFSELADNYGAEVLQFESGELFLPALKASKRG